MIFLSLLFLAQKVLLEKDIYFLFMGLDTARLGLRHVRDDVTFLSFFFRLINVAFVHENGKRRSEFYHFYRDKGAR